MDVSTFNRDHIAGSCADNVRSQLPAVNIDQARRWLSDRALGVDVFNFAIELKSPSDSENNQPFKFIGVLGSYHWPAVGYLIHPEYAGKGYATEALQAWLRAYFEHVPTSREGGFDYVEASTDTQNWGSRKVLERCGFKLCEIHEKDFENLVFGLRDTAVYRIARPGTVLEDLGFIERGRVGSRLRSDGDAPVPPVQ